MSHFPVSSENNNHLSSYPLSQGFLLNRQSLFCDIPHCSTALAGTHLDVRAFVHVSVKVCPRVLFLVVSDSPSLPMNHLSNYTINLLNQALQVCLSFNRSKSYFRKLWLI